MFAAALILAATAASPGPFLDVFNGFCVTDAPHWEAKIDAAAKLYGWKLLEVFPREPGSPPYTEKRWTTNIDGMQLSIGYISETDEAGVKQRRCEVLWPARPAGVAELLIERNPELTPIDDQTDDWSRRQRWSGQINNTTVQVELETIVGAPGVSLTLMVPD